MNRITFLMACGLCVITGASQQLPHSINGGYELPNGWRITPLGRAIQTEDMVLNVSLAPDRKAVVALHAGFNPHGLVVVDPHSEEAVQRIPLKSAWLGLAWHPSGKKLYVSGGNANGKKPTRAPIYIFDYENGRLSKDPSGTLEETVDTAELFWSGLVHHHSRPLLFAANRGTGPGPSNVVVFDTTSGKLLQRIPVEVNPYALVLSDNGQTLYVSNWGSSSVSVIDVNTRRVTGRISVGDNPNDMAMSKDGRLFVSCANDNTVSVIDTKTRGVIERISTALTPNSPEGSTPNALALDRDNQMLFVANADNNDVAAVRVADRAKSEVLGFIPVGWYPSALAIQAGKLYVGNSKGMGSYSDVKGPGSPLASKTGGDESVKSLQKGTVEIVDLTQMKANLRTWSKQVYDNTPYHDDQLVAAKTPTVATVIPREVGAGSPIKHVLYIIKENRTYDQVLGDLGKGNGDSRLTIFGETVTPNHHAIARQFVLLDNLFCDGEVSVDGHSWSNSAYATDFNEKLWPVTYGGHSKAAYSAAFVPSAGHLWDLAAKKGLTYRSYGEYATRASDGNTMQASPGVGGLLNHVSPKFKLPGMRDTDNAAVFLNEFEEYEKNYESPDPNKRLPNFMVMSLPEDHTAGTTPGRFTPIAMVANNDYAVGQIVDRITHSRYWSETAIFIIEDDAQDGPDHVDARRTTAYVVSPYTKRQTIDSTLYTTSSMLRTMELLLGLPPMSQYDAAANPMYASFSDKADPAPFTHVKPQVDVMEKNTLRAYGARRSMKMDFRDVDEAPMAELNEILWKSIKGADSPVPAPVHRVRFDGR
jgi:YVTN family beta-propeller protein